MINQEIYQKAVQTQGWFSEEEAGLLIHHVQSAPKSANFLEIGCYKGRSTLFFLSAMTEKQLLVSVDPFWTRRPVEENNFLWTWKNTQSNQRIILPMTLPRASKYLKNTKFSVILIDGNHLFHAIAIDMAYIASMSCKDVVVLFHDYEHPDWPAVKHYVDLIVESICGARVLGKVGQLIAVSFPHLLGWL